MKIGIVGGGQLGRMLALAGIPLGFEFRIWTDSFDLKTSAVGEQVVGPFELPSASSSARERFEKFCQGLDAVTVEWENIPVELARTIQAKCERFFPDPGILENLQDRFVQKESFRKLKLPTARYFLFEPGAPIPKGFRFPLLLKTCTHGYDGKGQQWVNQESEFPIDQARWIAEEKVPFSKEVSLVTASSHRGKVLSFYPLCQNEHRNGILIQSMFPFRNRALQKQAETIAKKIARHFEYEGVFTIEFFVVGKKLLINEMAPRVHNSGHVTIEGALTSQFENHLRAGLGLPLGATTAVGFTRLWNFLGKMGSMIDFLAVPGVSIHDYQKSPRAGRKVGHITLWAVSEKESLKTTNRIQKRLRKEL